MDITKRESGKPERYRVVKYYNQWPQGDEFAVLAEDLSKEEAEKICQKHRVGLSDVEITVEKMN
jgi:hypothetical protein